MRILFLDDSKERQRVFQQNTIGHVVAFASTADEAIELLQADAFDQIWLDHDLEYFYVKGEPRVKTGRDVVRHIVENVDRHQHSTFVIHTLNPDGGKCMAHDLRRAGLSGYGRIWRKPFAWQEKEFIESIIRLTSPSHPQA